MEWDIAEGRLKPVRFTDKLALKTVELRGVELFELALAHSPLPQPVRTKASEWKISAAPKATPLVPNPRSPRLAERYGGQNLTARLDSPDGNLNVEWRAELRDESNYVRQFFTFRATQEPAEALEVVLLDANLPGARTTGTVDGVPIVAGDLFFGFENPLSSCTVTASRRARCGMRYTTPLRPEEPVIYTSVIGAAPEGQLRRSFVYYIERERAHPYFQNLQHNNGYDIGGRYTELSTKDPAAAARMRENQEKLWTDMIDTVGREMVQKRGGFIDSFVHDFRWDDVSLVWQFHNGFPNGWTALSNLARRYGASLGVWLSPVASYDERRVDNGMKIGFESMDYGLAIGGKRYYTRCELVCRNMIRDYGVNYFKFDAFGPAHGRFKGPDAPPYVTDVEAMMRLMAELRRLKPDVFLNPTNGTWPSPYWLFWGDSVWRTKEDSDTIGKGSDRQQWITFRDWGTYAGVVKRSELYPISSLMIHGVQISRSHRVKTFEAKDMTDEIRSFFATGTNLQELYLTPDVLTPAVWDVLVEASKWARTNAEIFPDTHWVGADPGTLGVYGWASWSPRKGILALRNPDEKAAHFDLDIARVFELPACAAVRYLLKSPWKEPTLKPAVTVEAGRPRRLELKPFEILVFEALPME